MSIYSYKTCFNSIFCLRCGPGLISISSASVSSVRIHRATEPLPTSHYESEGQKSGQNPQNFFLLIGHKLIHTNPQESGRTICNNFVLYFLDNIVVNLIYLCICWQIVMTLTAVVEKL